MGQEPGYHWPAWKFCMHLLSQGLPMAVRYKNFFSPKMAVVLKQNIHFSHSCCISLKKYIFTVILTVDVR